MYSSSSGWLVFFSPVLSSSPDHLSLPPPLSAHQRSLPPICPFKTDAQRSDPSAQRPSERTVPADPGAIPERGAAGSAPEGTVAASPGEAERPTDSREQGGEKPNIYRCTIITPVNPNGARRPRKGRWRESGQLLFEERSEV